MVRPILFLYTRATTDENDPIAKAIAAALKLGAVVLGYLETPQKKRAGKNGPRIHKLVKRPQELLAKKNE